MGTKSKNAFMLTIVLIFTTKIFSANVKDGTRLGWWIKISSIFRTVMEGNTWFRLKSHSASFFVNFYNNPVYITREKVCLPK